MTPFMTTGSPLTNATINVSYTGTPGLTAAVNANTTHVRIYSTTDCFVEIGMAPVADAATSMPLAAYSAEYFPCPPGGKVSAIQSSVGGTIYVTPIA